MLQKLNRREFIKMPLALLFLASIIISAWEIYVAHRTCELAVTYFDKFIQDVVAGREFWFFKITAETHFGIRDPLWVGSVRIFWFALMPFLGIILALKMLSNFRRFDFQENFLIGGLAGVIILAVISLLGEAGGEYVRGLTYNGFFTAPIIVMFLSSQNKGNHPNRLCSKDVKFISYRRVKQLSFATLLAALLLLNFPTFLAHHHLVTSMSVYPQELACGNFLQIHTEQGMLLEKYYSDEFTSCIMRYYLFKIKGYNLLGNLMSEFHLRQTMDRLITDFEICSPSVFVYSKRIALVSTKNLGIELEHPIFTSAKNRLNIHSSLIYNDGFAAVFYH
jgi:hypothetical protein